MAATNSHWDSCKFRPISVVASLRGNFANILQRYYKCRPSGKDSDYSGPPLAVQDRSWQDLHLGSHYQVDVLGCAYYDNPTIPSCDGHFDLNTNGCLKHPNRRKRVSYQERSSHNYL